MSKNIKWKLNLFDFVIIAAAIAAVFIGYRLLNADRDGGALLSAGSDVTVRYTLELSNLPEGTGALIKPGDNVIEVVEKRAIGTVVSCEVSPYLMTSQNQITGDVILAEIPEREKAVIVLELRVTATDSELSANGFVVMGGVNLSVTGPGWAGQGLITDVERPSGS